jgi:flap endonuclease-1
MGVNLKDIIIKQEIKYKDLNNKIIGIDAYNTIYQFLSQIRQYDGSYFTDKHGNITSHLIGLFYRNIKLLEYNIKPVYIFDGKPPEFKKKTLEKRKEMKEKYREKYLEAIEKKDYKDAKRYASATSRIDNKIVEEAKELLDVLGIPFIQALSEAEAQASYMTKKGSIFAVGSQDYDSLLFGAKYIVRNINLKEELELIDLEQNLKNLGIDQDRLILIGMLVGTDFNEGIKGIGPKTALKIVKTYDIDYIMKKYNLDREVFEFFKNPPVTDNYNLEWKKINKENVLKLLVDKYNFSPKRVEEHLDKVLEVKKQKTLFDW